MRFLAVTFSAFVAASSAFAADFARDIRPLLETHCFDCHGDEEKPKGGANLERFKTDDDVMRDRAVWGGVLEKMESHQMPPPKRGSQPSATERGKVLAWIAEIAARPDPTLGARDPGKPVLRRLTRLEYNNTVRDLLGLDTDVFMFSERLPLADKNYFQPATGKLGDRVEVRLREYGGKYPVLLPQSGLPADNRAEHGFRNRGDAMNFSPLQLEQYVALAGEIVNHPDLPQRSRVFAELLGVEFNPLPAPAVATSSAQTRTAGGTVSPAVGVFAPDASKLAKAEGSPDWPEQFREQIAGAFGEGRGGVLDVGAASANTTVAGKGGLLRVPFGDAGTKTLTVNPDADLWLVSFATAEETSGSLLIANKIKKEKRHELTFKILGGDEEEGITRLGICVLGRSGQSGPVTLTARFTDDTATTLTATITEGAKGTTLFTFAAVPGEHIKSLVVDGSKFSGDYVLLDDLGFITSGRAVHNARPPATASVAEKRAPKAAPPVAPTAQPKTPVRSPVERLNAFVERTLRRPATAEEQARFHGVFDEARRTGKSDADAMRVAAQSVLSSPSFLFLAHPVPANAGKVRALDDYELASRLSYFLWASMPDEKLLAAARSGSLRDAATLEAHAHRMLRDVKVRELSESFAVQWLRLDQLYTSKPDRDLFKDYYAGPQGKDTLHGSQLLEALLLFETVLVEDRGLIDFVDADFTWLNPRLAKVYGLEYPASRAVVADSDLPDQSNRELKKRAANANNRWHRTALTDKARGGFLTMGASLTVTSLPFRTSPVKRGAWLLETVFNRPPTEPKVAFVVENDTREAARSMSIRERFEAHRSRDACYTCHIRLDPPGFALERFDAVGVWRETDGGRPVDAAGEWNGLAFDGPAGFKAVLMAHPEEFVRGFIEHLLSYALGRKLEIYDQPTVLAIQRAARADGYRFSRVVAEIVNSH
ncbi:MAG: DUF1592 domain-containing protein, partial [Verrucomicrobiae bacterium]|nr:DUF1592 domain-containing protein [Verrucomicrobiae bacterium]